jgi:hypothetical protein
VVLFLFLSKQIFVTFQLGPSTQLGMDAMLQVQEKARKELECVICLDVPHREIQVFSCLQHHLMCSECNKHAMQSCPVCRQDFKKTPPARNRLAEKMIQQLN